MHITSFQLAMALLEWSVIYTLPIIANGPKNHSRTQVAVSMCIPGIAYNAAQQGAPTDHSTAARFRVG
jgi:hypothetical protein